MKARIPVLPWVMRTRGEGFENHGEEELAGEEGAESAIDESLITEETTEEDAELRPFLRVLLILGFARMKLTASSKAASL